MSRDNEDTALPINSAATIQGHLLQLSRSGISRAVTSPRYLTHNYCRRRNMFSHFSNSQPTTSSPASPIPQVPTTVALVEPVVSSSTEWVCAICMEGTISNPDVVEHECGRHIYHVSCLFDNRYTDPRCALCFSAKYH